jgi:uncharacterized membrane protein (DUF485 family)
VARLRNILFISRGDNGLRRAPRLALSNRRRRRCGRPFHFSNRNAMMRRLVSEQSSAAWNLAIMQSRNTRLGLALFAVYLLFYGGFVLIAAFSPESMELLPFAGVNVAVWYGFGLIVLALVLALIYGWACHSDESSAQAELEAPGGGR